MSHDLKQRAGSLADGLDNNPAGKGQSKAKGDGKGLRVVKVIVVSLVIVGAVGFAVTSLLNAGSDPLVEATKRRVMIDSETGEVFEDFRMPDGQVVPFRNPKTGAMTLYPAEACYWTSDGRAKIEPTYVLIN
ncbi:MAG: hypothetical protein AAF747_08135, partial [Planctomycetota bacterium]